MSTHLRYSPELARLYFGIEGLEEIQSEYYYWDTTTLAMKPALLEYVEDGCRVLEIGPGPAATLDILLAKQKRGLDITCAEIDRDFIRTARRVAEINGVTLKILESDMTQNVHGKFDVVFMNPPYVKAQTLHQLGIARESGEGKAGFGGEEGCDVIDRFLEETPSVLNPDGIALLGVNNRHVEDTVVSRHIEESPLELKRRYFGEKDVYPQGPYSQVYVLTFP
jgi:methylase of polypeptide subunit release factors